MKSYWGTCGAAVLAALTGVGYLIGTASASAFAETLGVTVQDLGINTPDYLADAAVHGLAMVGFVALSVECRGARLRRRVARGRPRRPTRGGHLLPVDSLSAQKALARAGLGLALLPASAARDELETGRLVSLKLSPPLPPAERDLWRAQRRAIRRVGAGSDQVAAKS